MTATYKTTLNLPGGRSFDMEGTAVVRRDTVGGAPVFRISADAKTPMGDASDSFVVDASTLRPISRSAKQGPAVVEVKYGDREVTGTIEAGGQKIPINIAVEAPVFGDQMALDIAVAALPLASGYRASIRTPETGMQNRIRYWALSVAGEEPVTVPAGTFDTWKVVLEPVDNEGGGRTFWITRGTPRVIVKSEWKLPAAMGGGLATSELVKRSS
jgi:hypothetical protein